MKVLLLAMMQLLCFAVVANSKEKEPERSPGLMETFDHLGESFGSRQRTKVKLTSAEPTEVAMLRDKAPGKMWLAELGSAKFKITIESKTDLKIKDALERLQKIPEPYRRAFVIVSEGQKDGVAFYADLHGAAGHGSENYLNLTSDADARVISHEIGHILEQRRSQKDPQTLDKWKQACEADKISVSAYGDGAVHEDLAEFASVYALCLDAGRSELTKLKSKSPQRFALWETILFDK